MSGDAREELLEYIEPFCRDAYWESHANPERLRELLDAVYQAGAAVERDACKAIAARVREKCTGSYCCASERRNTAEEIESAIDDRAQPEPEDSNG